MSAAAGAAWRALSGWLDGPASLLAERQRSSRGRSGIQARLSEDGRTLLLRSPARLGQQEAAIALPSGGDEPADIDAVSTVVKGRRVALNAPPGWVIERRIDLPLEAGDHLDGIVAARIGALSPLPAQDMLYGHRVVESDRERKRIVVAIALVPKARATAILDLLVRAGARGVEIVAPLSRDGAIVLHPQATRGAGGNGVAKALLALLLVAGVLTAGAATAARFYYAERIAAQRATVEARAAEARNRISAHMTPDTASTRPQQLALEIKNGAISALGALDDLALALPDHAYASEIMLTDGRLRIAGRTTDLPDVLTSLESSGRFVESGLVGPATRAEDDISSNFTLETRPLIRTDGALR